MLRALRVLLLLVASAAGKWRAPWREPVLLAGGTPPPLNTQPPNFAELCAFGQSLPFDRIIVITGPHRYARVQGAVRTMCLRNVRMLAGRSHPNNESEITAEERSMLAPENFGNLTLGEIAIHLSHRRALDACVDLLGQPAKSCLIMEDDFTLSGPRLAERINASLRVLPSQWDLLMVGRCVDYHCADDERVSGEADLYHVARNASARGAGMWIGEPTHWQFGAPMCLHAYAVSRKGAEAMAEAMNSCTPRCPADWAPAKVAQRGNTYKIAPSLITQSSALRLYGDSQAVLSDEDAKRGLTVNPGDAWRPALVSECAPDNRLPTTTNRISAFAPWYRENGGNAQGQLDHALQWAYDGYRVATYGGADDASTVGFESNASFSLEYPADSIPPRRKPIREANTASLRHHSGAHLSAAAPSTTTIRGDPASDYQSKMPHLHFNEDRDLDLSDERIDAATKVEGLPTYDPTLRACAGLFVQPGSGLSRRLLVDSAWMPGPEALDASMQGCALQYVSTLDDAREICLYDESIRTELAETANVSPEALNFLLNAERPGAAAPSLRCPVRTASAPPAKQIGRDLARLQCVATVSGYTVDPNHDADQKPQLTRTRGDWTFFESPDWPKPAVCAYRSANVPRMRPAQRFLWPKLNKMVNRHRRLEYRPLFKVGSTYVSQLLPCLQPGEWTEVPINTTMPADYTALVFVREPIRRFVSGLSEVIRRTFLGQCPSGPCTADGDTYWDDEVNRDLAASTSWYRHALLLNMTGSALDNATRRRAIRELLTAAVTDTSCNLQYYGSEHFMAQTTMMVQGSDLSKSEAEVATMVQLEQLGSTGADLAQSPLLAAIGAENVPKERLDFCASVAFSLDHPTRPDARPDARTAATTASALPTEAELRHVLEGEEGLILSLCYVYAQDHTCMSSEYQLPEVCTRLMRSIDVQTHRPADLKAEAARANSIRKGLGLNAVLQPE